MDAARSAWRSGASPVTIVYRRGRAEMPAQAEEIEAAEREGIVVRTGLAPIEVVSRDGAVVGIRCVETRPATGRRRRRRGRAWEPVPRRRATNSRRPRSSSPSARSRTRRSCPRAPASRSAAGPASSPTRGRWRRAGPASSPVATSCPGRRRSSTPSRPDGVPRHRSTSTSPAPPTARRDDPRGRPLRHGARGSA